MSDLTKEDNILGHCGEALSKFKHAKTILLSGEKHYLVNSPFVIEELKLFSK